MPSGINEVKRIAIAISFVTRGGLSGVGLFAFTHAMYNATCSDSIQRSTSTGIEYLKFHDDLL